MGWSWTIGRIAGIKVRMHWTFLLLLLWVGVSYGTAGGGLVAAIKGIVFVLAIFACVILHEAGHALMARRYGVPTQDITLLPIGGVARLQRIPSEPWKELWIAVAGPAVNVVIAAVLFFGLAGAYGLGIATQQPTWATSLFVNLMWVNVLLVAFNLLPAFPMDGGRVLRAVLAMRMNYAQATDVAAGVGQFMAILFGVIGLFWFWNPLLLLIALFVYLGAAAEARTVRLREAMRDLHVSDAMVTNFHTLSPDDSLHHAVEELLSGSQQDFPIVDQVGLRGMLRRPDLVKALRERGDDAPVSSAAAEVDNIVGENDPLARTFEMMQNTGCRSLPVLRENKLVGLVTLENVAELMLVKSATDGDHASWTVSGDRQ